LIELFRGSGNGAIERIGLRLALSHLASFEATQPLHQPVLREWMKVYTIDRRKRWPEELDTSDRWKPALHAATFTPTRRLFPDATTTQESLTGVQGESGFGRT
jgi:hypothetical protein